MSDMKKCPFCANEIYKDAVKCQYCGEFLNDSILTGEIRVGESLSHYNLVKQIGKGGMAVVYLAEDTKLKRNIAIKVLPMNLIHDSDLVERFKIEARTSASLRHPNIINIHIINETKVGQPFFIMDYLDSGTLDDKLKTNELSQEDKIKIMKEILTGLQYAHDKKVIHRDLKPENIMFNSAGFAVITDFGIAKAGMGTKAATQTGMVIGTPKYMSPEQCGTGSVDTRSDIYSAGILFYEMFTKQVPFDSEIPTTILHKHIYEEPIVPSKIEESIPVWLDSIIMKCLEKNPDDRFQSCAEILRAIDEKINSPYKSQNTQLMQGVKNSKKMQSNFNRMIFFVVGIAIVAMIFYYKNDKLSPQKKILHNSIIPISKEIVSPIPTSSSDKKQKMIPFSSNKNNTTSSPFKNGSNIDQIDKLINLGNKWIENQEWENGINTYTNVIKLDPDNYIALARRGYCYIQSKNMTKGVDDLERSIKINDKNSEAYSYRGLFESKMEHYDSAIKELQKALELDPNNKFALFQLGKIYVNKKEFDTAIDYLNRSMNLGTPTYEEYYQLGISNFLLKNYNRAVANFSNVVKIKPGFSNGYLYRGISYSLSGDVESGLKDIKNALVLDPNNKNALKFKENIIKTLADKFHNSGREAFRNKEYGEAITDFTKAINYSPNNAQYYFDRGITYGVKKELENSLSDLSQAIKIDPYEAEPYIFRSKIYRKLGRYSESQSDKDRYNSLK